MLAHAKIENVKIIYKIA